MVEYHIYPLYKGKPLIPSVAAQREIDQLCADLWLVKRVLEEGHDCARSRRKTNIVEKCLIRKGKEIRAVVALVEWEDKGFWRVVHVGSTGRH
ncbi:MAG: hypothetical protein HY051_03580 [Candidatus Aenigmarchaeota archaeon]|nr:hypothetical protein [Candidatus Aenigmarchaeota archaeon]